MHRDQLKQTAESIVEKLSTLQQLKSDYNDHFNTKYLATMNEIMTKFKDGCQVADKKYANIEKQIDDNRQITYLLSEISYYNKQEEKLENMITKKQQQLKRIKLGNLMLQKKKINLEKQFYSKSKSLLKNKFKFLRIIKKQKQLHSKELKSSCNKSTNIQLNSPQLYKINISDKKFSNTHSTKPYSASFYSSQVLKNNKLSGKNINFYSNSISIQKIAKNQLMYKINQNKSQHKKILPYNNKPKIFEISLKHKNRLMERQQFNYE